MVGTPRQMGTRLQVGITCQFYLSTSWECAESHMRNSVANNMFTDPSYQTLGKLFTAQFLCLPSTSTDVSHLFSPPEAKQEASLTGLVWLQLPGFSGISREPCRGLPETLISKVLCPAYQGLGNATHGLCATFQGSCQILLESGRCCGYF